MNTNELLTAYREGRRNFEKADFAMKIVGIRNLLQKVWRRWEYRNEPSALEPDYNNSPSTDFRLTEHYSSCWITVEKPANPDQKANLWIRRMEDGVQVEAIGPENEDISALAVSWEECSPAATSDQIIPFAFEDPETQKIQTGWIKVEPTHLAIHLAGYGEKTATDDQGCPIVVEKNDGCLRVLVWADINREDPTTVCNLQNARLDCRTEEE